MDSPAPDQAPQSTGAPSRPLIQAALVHSIEGVRLHPRWHHRARVIWGIVAVLTLGMFVGGILSAVAQLHALCPTPTCRDGALTPEAARVLGRLGLTPREYVALLRSLQALRLTFGFYIVYLLALQVIFAAVYTAVAVLIFWRRSDHLVALFGSLALLLFGMATFGEVLGYLVLVNPGWRYPVAIVAFLGSAIFGLFLYLFPEGRFVPAWMRWIALAWVIWQFPHAFFAGSFLDEAMWPLPLSFAAWLAFFATVVYAQVYRYRRVSTPAQQQQTKWVVHGVAVALVGYFVLAGIGEPLLASSGSPSPGQLLALMAASTGAYVFMLFIPASIGIAILRHHLFDIDLIINRTLVYGSLTGILALVYQTTLIALQSLFVALTGQTSFLATVISTVLIGALFEPLRRRLQQLVNRFVARPVPRTATP